jgi:hypothetical protein
MDIERYYVQKLILETVWQEEEEEGRISSFVLTVMMYRVSENMTRIDKDHTEMSARLLISFCCENNVVSSLYLANHGKRW